MIRFLAFFVLISCTSVFYQPDRIQYVRPENYNFNYKEITFHAKDKTELIGWFFPAKTAVVKGTIIHYHGNAQNMSAHFLGLSWVMEQGYNLFAFDYRGYGISDGDPTPDGVYKDSVAALDEGHRLWSENGKGKFVVYGQSLGGVVAMRALRNYKNISQVDLVVQDGTFTSYQDVAFYKLTHSPLLPFGPLSYLVVSDKYSSKQDIKKITRPVLVVVGQNDSVINQKFGKEIFKNLKTKKKWIWKIPNGEHITTFHDPKGPYRGKFIQLLDSL